MDPNDWINPNDRINPIDQIKPVMTYKCHRKKCGRVFENEANYSKHFCWIIPVERYNKKQERGRETGRDQELALPIKLSTPPSVYKK